jgi:hypothetical protein
MPLMIPVRAKGRKLEANNRWAGRITDFDAELLRVDAPFADAVVRVAPRHDLNAAAHVVAFKLLVCEDATVVTKLMRVVGWKVLGTEFIVRHRKLRRSELSDVANVSLVWIQNRILRFLPFVFVGTTDMSCAPTRVDQLPFAVIDANSIPSVVRGERWDWLTGFQRCMAKPFTVSGHHKSLETCLECQSSK